jgi:hypothetical protein
LMDVRTFWLSSRRYLCTTTACSPGLKGRKGRKAETRPVRGDWRNEGLVSL